jgi:hypothetical protein
MRRLVGWTALLVLFAGCQSPGPQTIYVWGHYEDLIYTSYAEPGKAPPEMQVEKLEEDFQKARAANRPVPPGFHAHLGFLYYQLGKIDQAHQEFQTEKANFPESAVFMDRLLDGLKK